MNKTTITLSVLILLTVISAIISGLDGAYIALAIMILAVLKFIGVSFCFMELKHAHAFWKGSVLVFLAIITTTILIII